MAFCISHRCQHIEIAVEALKRRQLKSAIGTAPAADCGVDTSAKATVFTIIPKRPKLKGKHNRQMYAI